MSINRRGFIGSAIAASLATGLNSVDSSAQAKAGGEGSHSGEQSNPSKRPIIICANNGVNYLDGAFAFLKDGGDTLDTAMRVIRGPEDDPNVDSVGLGGLPNEDGVVELDACCMHGPTRRAGSVGGVRNIKNVSLVSKAVMDHTGHVMLVGEGAERFAVDMGFPRENLLTDHSRKVWLLWKEYHSNEDWWGPGLDDPRWQPPEVNGDSKPQADLTNRRFRRLEQRATELGIAPELRED